MIRVAKKEDIPAILLLCEEFWKHTLYDEEFDCDHTQVMVNMALEHGLLEVLDLDGIVGFVAGIKSYLMASTEALTGTELAWWVNPAHRKGRKGIDLMLFIEDLARAQGVKYWNMVSMESSDPEIANKIYERLGYKKTETSFTKVL